MHLGSIHVINSNFSDLEKLFKGDGYMSSTLGLNDHVAHFLLLTNLGRINLHFFLFFWGKNFPITQVTFKGALSGLRKFFATGSPLK